ncbi:hypothetical protein PFISCL1PPCAC_8822, partial [Pristionchus fissidentatus]
ENIPAISKLEIKQSFVIGGQLYVTSKPYFGRWSMYSIDTKNFFTKEAGNDLDLGYNFRNHPVIVHKECAYTFNDSAVVKGSVDCGRFHWTLADTTGPAPDRGLFSTRICYVTEGDAPKYGLLLAESVFVGEEDEAEDEEAFAFERERVLHLCELDLNTMEWTRRSVPLNETAFEMVCVERDVSAHAFRGNLHLNASGFRSGHLVLDLTTLTWSVACSGQTRPCYIFFVARDDLYKIGSLNRGENMIIFKYLEADNEWIEVHDTPFSFVENCTDNLTLCTTGSRVFFVGANDKRMMKIEGKRISVLELDPTLFDHSMALLLR